MTIACDPEGVVAVINELRDVAEAVRTYGDLGAPPGGGRWSLAGMPMQLLLLAAAVEAQLRSLIHTDQVCASRLFRQPVDPARTVLHFDLTIPDSVVVSAVSTEICVAELGDAHRRLIAATTRLRSALQSPATAVFENLEKEAEQLRLFVAAFA